MVGQMKSYFLSSPPRCLKSFHYQCPSLPPPPLSSPSLILPSLQFKLGKVKRVQVGPKGVPFCVTHDGRTIRYPDPLIKVHDTVKIRIDTGSITDFTKFETGNVAMVTGGRNLGRVGVILTKERHPGSHDIVQLKDATGNTFATRLGNVFVIGKGSKPIVSLPRGKGVRLTIAEERDRRLARQGMN